MKKTIKIVQSVLLLCIFLLFNSLFWIVQANQTEFTAGNDEAVYCFSSSHDIPVIQSFFNEEESDDYEKEFVASTHISSSGHHNTFTIKRKYNTIESCFQHFIFVLQTDLPPPRIGSNG